MDIDLDPYIDLKIDIEPETDIHLDVVPDVEIGIAASRSGRALMQTWVPSVRHHLSKKSPTWNLIQQMS